MIEPGDQLFRREAGRMVAALTRLFGVHNLELAEDVVQDAFCRAVEVWRVRGIPDNPAAWLMAAAKHRALDLLRRDGTARTYAPELGRLLETEWTLGPVVDEAFSVETIADDQLRMMFSCCHPRLKQEVQIALILHILCGFSVAEIAAAFLASDSAIEKRISRGKRALAASKHLFDLREADIEARLDGVQRALYLLFNEGYHGAHTTEPVRAELCHEALRLTLLLHENPRTAAPSTLALSALMCFLAARLPGRIDATGHMLSLYEQDRSQWDAGLIARGRELLDRSAHGDALTAYHVEAAIAALHAAADSSENTNWGGIVELFDQLLMLRPSPVIALNRAVALAHHIGADAGLAALRAIDDRERLASYPFYPAAMGELELRLGNLSAARDQFLRAASLARNPLEQEFLLQRAAACEPANGGA